MIVHNDWRILIHVVGSAFLQSADYRLNNIMIDSSKTCNSLVGF